MKNIKQVNDFSVIDLEQELEYMYSKETNSKISVLLKAILKNGSAIRNIELFLGILKSDFQETRDLAFLILEKVPAQKILAWKDDLFKEAEELLNSSWTISRLKGEKLMLILTKKAWPTLSTVMHNTEADLQRRAWIDYLMVKLKEQVQKVKLDWNNCIDGSPMHGYLLVLVAVFVFLREY